MVPPVLLKEFIRADGNEEPRRSLETCTVLTCPVLSHPQVLRSVQRPTELRRAPHRSQAKDVRRVVIQLELWVDVLQVINRLDPLKSPNKHQLKGEDDTKSVDQVTPAAEDWLRCWLSQVYTPQLHTQHHSLMSGSSDEYSDDF